MFKSKRTFESRDGNTSNKEDTSEKRLQSSLDNDRVDCKFGFERVKSPAAKTGWLLNFHPTEILDEDKRLISAIDYYFLEEDGSRFKTSYPFKPYFFILPEEGTLQEISVFLSKKFAGLLTGVEIVVKEDLDLPNHLSGLKRKFLKLSFLTVTDLNRVKKELLAAVRRNRERAQSQTAYTELLTSHMTGAEAVGATIANKNHLDNIVDIREYDVPYHVRAGIDTQIFIGKWYSVTNGGAGGGGSGSRPPSIVLRPDLIEWPECVVLAYDIETTKLPLKFPDAKIDQIMMISYMIDGQGYLITNREVIGQDIEDFEYTPKPEFHGPFTVFNEPNEAATIQRFFDHIIEVKPHIFVTYNGDFFDWPFVEARAAVHGLSMLEEIGFAKNTDDTYLSRASIHMDCLCWVRRDSYLPVGSQGLKAVAKAKLRYDPVELNPEDMCRMACEEPQVLSNYSVSDAVATYYLYMKYVHPFIFALCTILPMDPDEVLRKGSGTLCEALLMVEAFKARIVFPNKQLAAGNSRLTHDGHVLDSETYVGGHVEAIESGIFRADIPCRFRMVPEAFRRLLDSCDATLRFAIEVEEQIPLDQVTNYDEVLSDVVAKLTDLQNNPNRLENPFIYHLDVGAMYPNIILTNRLQPSAIVDEATCAACHFNRPAARCRRTMAWMWRGEVMPAKRSELQHTRQQLEMERFPPSMPGGKERAFHQLSRDEQAEIEKKRLTDYCRRAYKKVHITRMEERATTICQRENSFYVDTVRSFRDRRYEYKALNKNAKKQLSEAQASGDGAEVRVWNSRVILYDSLQLAHKCILNSFYGYVMRKGARWHSMQMAGIVCYTGASLITRAREIIEQIGRPLELDTDGIWCILPGSFPENYVIKTTNAKKPQITVSYPNAVLNVMVKDHFTNDQYHELTDPETLKYSVRSENSIFFEVDGPYLAMILPASKEEGKKLKKRYAVFNFDGSLAELKGFEVKRRGELQLIKIFQSSVFEAFLKGSTLEEAYASVARIADYWLDVLYSKGANMPDSELFELISENRSMSKTLAEYGAQKSTSIATARRLAEFLGDQIVKDAGLACQYIISRQPDGAPVTERAIPLAIFRAEMSVRRHYLRRWLKDSSLTDFDLRQILDWNYYVERLGGCVQKIITIPAALQGVSNPVPRVRHPDWLHKRMLEKNDTLKQRKIFDMFKAAQPQSASAENTVAPESTEDIEDLLASPPAGGSAVASVSRASLATKRRRPVSGSADDRGGGEDRDASVIGRGWRQVLGDPPAIGSDRASMLEWLSFHKRKWRHLLRQRAERVKRARLADTDCDNHDAPLLPAAHMAQSVTMSGAGRATMSSFLRRTQHSLLDSAWQIIQIAETNTKGLFRLWCMVGEHLHVLKLVVPRIFYVNQRTAKASDSGDHWRRCVKLLPRSHRALNLYEYAVPEEIYHEHSNELMANLSSPDIEGIYETQTPTLYRIICQLGCVCRVDPRYHRQLSSASSAAGGPADQPADTFQLSQLMFVPIKQSPYLPPSTGTGGGTGFTYRYIYLYMYRSGVRGLVGVCIPAAARAMVLVLNTERSNQLPNLRTLYSTERQNRLAAARANSDSQQLQLSEEQLVPPAELDFQTALEVSEAALMRAITRQLQAYRDEKRGPTLVVVQSYLNTGALYTALPVLAEFPLVALHTRDSQQLFQQRQLDWQRVGARTMLQHYCTVPATLCRLTEQSRYFHCPIGNIPADAALFGDDLFFGRHLRKNNYVLWASESERPDLGGKEADDQRLLVEGESSTSTEINCPAAYDTVCVDIDLDGLAATAILQSHHINEVEGVSSYVAFDSAPQVSLEDMLTGDTPQMPSYDDSALSYSSFKVLRSMVQSLLLDVTHYQNQLADNQLIHLYRWITSPTSLLYDPALKTILHMLMKKLFLQLLSELKRLGAVVVFASFTKLVLSTKKRTVDDALAYVSYVLDTVRSRELFQTVDLSVNHCWRYLLWQDQVNFGGIKAALPSASQDQEEPAQSDTNCTQTDSEEVSVEMSWNLAHYLPEAGSCQTNFNTIIASYISAVYQNVQSELQSLAPSAVPVQQGTSSQPVTQFTDTVEFAKQLVSGEMAQKLFLITEKLHKKLPRTRNGGTARLFPSLPGSHLTLDNPALEFVKAICKVLSLDERLECQLTKLRRDLLRLIGVGEFSAPAEWRDPCRSHVLCDVICAGCSHCCDLDLCRAFTVHEDKFVWCCSLCQMPYDKDEIQMALLSYLRKLLVSYVLQDSQCAKCKQVKQLNMSVICECAGCYRGVVSRAACLQKLHVLARVADSFQLQLLAQQVQWTLAQCGDDGGGAVD